MTYLLDTNTCIEYLNGRSPRFVERLQSKMPEEIVVCSVVKAELRYGAERSRNPREAFAELDEFLAPYRSLPFRRRVRQGVWAHSGTARAGRKPDWPERPS